MSYLRAFVLGSIVLLACVGIVCLCLMNDQHVAIDHDKPRADPFTLVKSADDPPIMLMDEDTGELWRKVNVRNDGIKEIEVWYKDGRFGIFTIILKEEGTEEHVKNYKGFAKNDKKELVYEAEYDLATAMIQSSVWYAGGKVESRFQRLPDGTEEVLFYDKQFGTCVKSVSTYPDGSQKTVEQSTNTGEAPRVTEIKADLKEVEFGEWKLRDGKTLAKFKTKLKGVRLQEWQYVTPNEKLRGTGVVNADGSLGISFFNDTKNISLVMTWRCVGEDWARRFYRLKVLETSTKNGGKESYEMYPDGLMIKTSTVVEPSGFIKERDFYDEKGYWWKQITYSQGDLGGPNYENISEFPPETRKKYFLPSKLLHDPGFEGTEIYRLTGMPFGQRFAFKDNPVNPLFVLP